MWRKEEKLLFFRSEKLEKTLRRKGKSPLPAARVRHNIKKFDLGRWQEYTPISIRSCKRRIQCNALLEWLPNNGFQRPKHDSQSNLSWKRCIQCSNVNLWGHVVGTNEGALSKEFLLWTGFLRYQSVIWQPMGWHLFVVAEASSF